MYIRYNSGLKFWEYDTSAAQDGTGPWIILPVDPTKMVGGGSTVPHHATHETGGADALITLDGSVIKTGTVIDARLSSNVALRNIDNGFSANQSIGKVTPSLYLNEPSQPADLRSFRIVNSLQIFYIQAMSDIGVGNSGYFSVSRSGGTFQTGVIQERGRAFPLGEWQVWTPTWSIYGGGNGSIGNGTLSARYAVIGKVVFFTIRLTIGSTTNFGASYWAFTLPSGFPPNTTDITGSALCRSATTGQTFIGVIASGAFYFGIANSIGIITIVPGLSYQSYVYNLSPFTWAVNDSMWLSGFYET